MLISLFRAVIIYVLIIISMRLLGKRQIGELQPSELVITILLSEVFAIPLQDTKIPLMSTIVSVLLLVGFEIILSFINLKSAKFRRVLEGNSVLIIKDGSLDQKALKKLRFTVDDLLEALRKKNVFDVSTVQYAVVETDGTLSIKLKSDFDSVTPTDLKLQKEQSTMQYLLISDGKLLSENLSSCGLTEKGLKIILDKNNLNQKDIFVMTCDKNQKSVIIKRNNEV